MLSLEILFKKKLQKTVKTPAWSISRGGVKNGAWYPISEKQRPPPNCKYNPEAV